MKTQQNIDYQRIAKAIAFLYENFKEQPSLDEIAAHIHLSPAHFQRLFTRWAGTSPKKFLQYLSVNHAKSLLQKPQVTLFDTTLDTGLSSTSRLHDLFVTIEGMTPAEYKNKGENLVIHYYFYNSPFGEILVASTSKGVCHLAFSDDSIQAVEDLKSKFAKAKFEERPAVFQQNAIAIFQKNKTGLQQIKLHLKGSDFQLKVWESLLKIPCGRLTTYGNIANDIDQPKASRAVGTAIGSNPVAYLIPCHRVIQSSGVIGNYMWGSTRKKAIIGWERVIRS
ncbi:methylated-DNA--[protein]-cysteine S-methyltransferase [Mesonia sp. K7]|uniref:methylated-DNA--[protein]-cysteine S-methyltransferase n=1 Tax=Mesonia sp. K7 TaxID=2218606 RepID=UPI000DA93CD5|nr:methylated-DNA--[protein]-cysteine S-methyltransferase [Mesonia sp. K7]PZD78323.1 cysteine methyltransferase [Mesonia sp. K7]